MLNKQIFVQKCTQAGVTEKRAEELFKAAELKRASGLEKEAALKMARELGRQDSFKFIESLKNKKK